MFADDFRSITRAVVLTLWRRRLVLVIPLIILIPLSIVGSFAFPRTFVSRSLLLLDDRTVSNPLSREQTAAEADRTQEVAAGLQTLLTSDLILGQIMVAAGLNSADPRVEEQRLLDLRRALYIRAPGSKFIELAIRGNSPEGLTRLLEIATVQLMASLYSTEGSISGAQLLLQKRKADVAQARKRARQLADLLKARPEDNPGPRSRELQALEQAISKDEEFIANYEQRTPDLRGGGLLRGPEQIRIIDMPTRAVTTSLPRSILMLAGIVGSLLIAGVLVTLAQVTDQTVRDPQDLASAVPGTLIVRIPKLSSLPYPAQGALPQRLAAAGDPDRMT